MTDGIIQEVFKKYYTGGFEVDIDDNTVNVIPQRVLEDAFKELIEKIKQEFNCIGVYTRSEILEELIGDNK